ncbi:hypothetical protein [Psychroserpens mesophilus]|uniref:hypothetical protein n=1 Tax=Psychroserpens mesophilus TaxID=325473 RepID=UPI00058DD5BD|nr:hypothetical protein [Psychroserpens mesophilus]
MIEFKLKDIIIIFIILGITFGYFLDDLILDYDGNKFEFYDVENLIYHSKMKILIIIICLVWYFTCKHWWKSSILVIITIELLKLISIFNPNQFHVDRIEYLTSLPITIPIILLLLFISKKISNYNLAKDLKFHLDVEIDHLFFELYEDKNNEICQLNKKLNELRKEKSTNVKDVKYLEELISLRNEFYKI